MTLKFCTKLLVTRSKILLLYRIFILISVYVEASDECNQLTFAFGTMGLGAPIPNRAFSIKVSAENFFWEQRFWNKVFHFNDFFANGQVTQLSCMSPLLAPEGCVNYFFGSQQGTVRSYNYQNRAGLHLADQEQTICVRRERGSCRICWTDVNDLDFGVSGRSIEISPTFL